VGGVSDQGANRSLFRTPFSDRFIPGRCSATSKDQKEKALAPE